MTVIDLVRRVVQQSQDPKAMLAAIAAGQDGIPGTPDDLISQETLFKLQVLLDSTILDDLIADIQETSVRWWHRALSWCGTRK